MARPLSTRAESAPSSAQDCGLQLSEWLASHVDWDGCATDLFRVGLYSVDTDGGVFLSPDETLCQVFAIDSIGVA